MNQQTDKEPIDYLRQRVKYYKKKSSKVMSLINDPAMVKQYGEKELQYIIARRLLSIASYVGIYKKAIKNLEEIEKKENETGSNT